ncbi:hypothetical protein C8F01DRAFT_1099232 [Mycena amicta]|nr:hypothetical protein C8F01DRAFT_1099232 [Mycena amicta]
MLQLHPRTPMLASASLALIVGMQMAAVVLESLLFGALLVLFSTFSYINRWPSSSSQHSSRSRMGSFPAYAWRSPVMCAFYSFLVLAASHWIITVYSFFSAFLRSGDGTLSAIFDAYNGRLMSLQTVNLAIRVVSMLVGDALLTHRTWVFWNRDWRIAVLPLFLWLVILVTGIVTEIYLFQPSDATFAMIFPWNIVNWTVSAAISIYCTGLIAWRIWRACQESVEMRARIFMSLLAVMIESATIWTAWSIFFVIVLARGSQVWIVVSSAVPCIIGITNVLIYVRIAAVPSMGIQTLRAGQATMTNNASIFRVGDADSQLDQSQGGAEWGLQVPLNSLSGRDSEGDAKYAPGVKG